MGTLYIDRKDLEVRLDVYAMAFYTNGEREGIIPIKPLKRIVVIGRVILETPVLHRLAEEGITVLFLSGKRQRYRGMFHGRLHKNGLLRLMQYRKTESSFTAEFSRELISRKVTLQKDMLAYAMEERADLRTVLCRGIATLESVIEKIKGLSVEAGIECLRGLEGGAAASYFTAYTVLFPDSLKFTKRTRRPPADPVNALLSLCYTLLHYEMVRETEVIGLDPTIGFYHQFEYGREPLACDLVEVFRPEVDRFVWKIFRERIFAERDFSCEDERPGCYLKKNSRSRFYPLYEEWAQEMRPQFRDEVRALARNIMDGEDVLQEYFTEGSDPTPDAE